MTRIQLRHDTATNWTTANPILAEGEVGVETDTNKFKIGDGITTWSELAYQGSNVDLSNYYTKTQTDTLLLDKEDNITPVAPISLEKKSISNLDGFTYATETTIVPNTYVEYSVTSSTGYPVDTYNDNHLSSSYILIPFHNSYVYKVPLDQITSAANAIMFGYFDENGVWVPVMQVKGTDYGQTFYYGPSSVFSYSGLVFQTTKAQRYNQAAANNTADVTAEDAQVIDGFTNAIQLRIADSASDGYICTVGMLTYTDQNKTRFRAQTMVWDSSSRAEDIAHLKKITHIAILPVKTTMPSSTYYSTTSFGMYEHNARIAWTPEAFISLIKSKENLYDLAGSSAQNYLELNLGDGLTVTNNLLTTTMNANDYYTKTQVDTLLNNKVGSLVGLFDCKWADHKLNEISWLEASTFSWQSGDVYTSAYDHLVLDIQSITAETETIGSYTVKFYRATDGHKICLADQEQTVLNIYNTYGIAWYYILDISNTRFKLPRTKYGFEGLRTNVGDKIDESLPNVKGNFVAETQRTSNAVAVAETFGDKYQAGGFVTRGFLSINASRSSSTYQDNAPVQERATQMYLYFYVGDYTQSAIEQTAGLNSELFNNKVDLNFDNMNPSQTAKDTIISWGMPDYDNGIGIVTGPASQLNYTAPSDGVIYGALQTVNATGTLGSLLVNNNIVASTVSYTGNPYCPTTTFVNKGDVITTDCLIYKTYFYPLKGAN